MIVIKNHHGNFISMIVPIFFIGIIPGDFCANNGSFFCYLQHGVALQKDIRERKKIHFDLYLF